MLPESEPLVSTGSSRALRVVLVDDDLSILRLVQHHLEKEGFSVVTAMTGADAQAILESHAWDLVILDRRLPDGDGLAICQWIKSEPRFMNLYVILISADAEASDKIEGLDRGADDYVTKPFHALELIARVRAGARIVELQRQLIEANQILERLSMTDALTNVYNRRHFHQEWIRSFEQARRYERPLSIAMIDVDHFKSVNDTYGHAAGDDVLREVAAVLQGSIRSTDLLARFGGEEFAVILPELTLEQAEEFGGKLRKTAEKTLFDVNDTTTTHVCVSVGVASLSRSSVDSAKELLDAADRALYRAKAKGRNRVESERRKLLRVKKPMTRD
ncbi:MAG TPA: diguanylate cyclase [Thermoanaerobaculia bacterium]|nr:diguanylate cyclase [Thermoanaerobaculia bacterium]